MPGDLPGEERLVGQEDLELLAEVENLLVEEEEVGVVAVRAPVAELELAVRQAVHGLADAHPQHAAGQARRLGAVDLDLRA